MWISLIRYWRSGFIWKRAKRKSKAFLLRGFLGIKSRSKSKSSERSGRRHRPGLGLLLVLAIE
jgi:hypothetical protein